MNTRPRHLPLKPAQTSILSLNRHWNQPIFRRPVPLGRTRFTASPQYVTQWLQMGKTWLICKHGMHHNTRHRLSPLCLLTNAAIWIPIEVSGKAITIWWVYHYVFPGRSPPTLSRGAFVSLAAVWNWNTHKKNSQVKKVCATRIRKQTKEWRVWCQLAVLCENTSCYLCLPWHFLTLQFEHRAGERKKLHICTALA